MTIRSSSVPSRAALTAGLSSVLGAPVAIARRRRNVHVSTFLSEVMTCRLARGDERTILCKYGAGPTDTVYGHKGGVVYEAAVYRDVLRRLPERLTRAAFHGAYTEADSSRTWLVLEYLESAARLHLTEDPSGALARASGWAGRFHALAERLLAQGRRIGLNTYTEAYYRGWAWRTSQFAGGLHQRLRWLEKLCKRFEEDVMSLLLDRPPTVIHGEYYPKNILLRGETVYPVDWESAAVAVGEIDLATLTEGWPADVVRSCEEEYARTRWPDGTPADFARTLTASRLYGLLRWLGDRPEWTTGRGAIGQFKQLGLLGEQLGVI